MRARNFDLQVNQNPIKTREKKPDTLQLETRSEPDKLQPESHINPK